MSRILVLGSHGRTGREVIRQLRQSSMTPIAGVRQQSQIPQFDSDGVEARLVDLRKSVSSIQESMRNVDAVIFTAGGGMMIDLDGKVKACQAAQQAGVKRFLLVSAGAIQHFHDDKRLEWMDQYEEYSAAMYYGDMFVSNSSLDYTIVRPETLLDGPVTGKVSISSYLPHGQITRADVAAVLIACLQDDRTIRREFDVMNGSQPISAALDEFLTQDGTRPTPRQ